MGQGVQIWYLEDQSVNQSPGWREATPHATYTQLQIAIKQIRIPHLESELGVEGERARV